MFFWRGKDFFKELFVNISSPVPSINNVQSLRYDLLLDSIFSKSRFSLKGRMLHDTGMIHSWYIYDAF